MEYRPTGGWNPYLPCASNVASVASVASVAKYRSFLHFLQGRDEEYDFLGFYLHLLH